MKGFEIFILIVLFIALTAGAFILIENFPGQSQRFEAKSSVPEMTGKTYLNGTQFYTNMRYPDKIISFSISENCNENKIRNAEESFSILSRDTMLKFNELSFDGEIQILCSNISVEQADKSHFVAGEGGPKDIYVSGPYHVITTGRVSLYRNERCNEPKIALHEILHALGFDHNENPRSIMYPVTSCNEILDDYIIDEINRLYTIKSSPDLVITSANAEKSNKYVSFEVEVSNYGFKDSNSVNLSVYAENKLIKDFNLENIPFGNKKKITVSNLVVPRSTQEIEFITYSTVSDDEISLDNNKIVLGLAG